MGRLALAFCLVLAGCVAPAANEVTTPNADLAALPALGIATAVPFGDGAWTWQGRELAGLGRVEWTQRFIGLGGYDCDPETRCDLVPIVVPEGLPSDVALQVVVQAADSDQDYAFLAPERSPFFPEYFTDTTFFFFIRLFDADGELVGETHDSYHQASVADLEAPAPGEHTLMVYAESGTSNYTGVARYVRPLAPPEGELLPDLALAPPYNLLIDAPVGREIAPALVATRGCGTDETTSSLALRCLRYATRIYNLGPGDFEERLSRDDAQAALAGSADARWTQTVRLADGTVAREEASGAAVFHPIHGHFHLNGLQRAYVYEYDETTGTRGAEVAAGEKTGLCMVDGGVVDLSLPVPPPNARDNGCCYYHVFCPLDLQTPEDFVQGISPGWFDTYPWWRADQYVEISALGDGTYEFVSVVDPDGIVLEADETNNEASVVFRLKGDAVEIVG